jgi:hypothetical protein
MRVAVIGAGAGGLTCARELLRVGLDVVVLEASEGVGGTWAYDPRPKRHGAMYASLRTNLPTDVMAFVDAPFEAALRFPGHAEVLRYLEDYALAVREQIRFGHRVERVAQSDDGFIVDDERFDAVAICTGHYHAPFVPPLPGLDGFEGRVEHSHDYRVPEPFRGHRVALLGAKASGIDISGDLIGHAAQVWLCGRDLDDAAPRAGIEYRAPIASIEGCALVLADGTRLHDVDDLLLCTGYDYAFPFLDEGLVTVEPKWVHPLWLDAICIRAPRLAFIGLPFQVVPFPLMQMQSRVFAHLLAGRIPQPGPAKMLAEHEASVSALDAEGVPRRHRFKYGPRQFDYVDRLAEMTGGPPMGAAFRAQYEAASAARRADPDGYRDVLSLP